MFQSVLNPFQVVIDVMVMFGWPSNGCCAIFRTHRHNNTFLHHGNSFRGDINDLQSSGRSEFLASETDPLLSFSRSRH